MKNSFEPIVLAVALGLLALVAAWLAYTFPTIELLTGVSSVEANGHVPQTIRQDELQSNLAPLATPQAWNTPTDNHRLFLSDVYLFYPSLYPGGNYIQKDDGSATTPGGVLISWCRKYHLDITDPNIDREDPDKDGFSNKAEFFAHLPIGTTKADGSQATNPLDPLSHPAYLSRLRLAKVDVRQFHIEFVGVVSLGGKNVFQIQLLDVQASGQPPLKHTGDPLGYEGWVVGVYTPKMVTKVDPGTHGTITVDESTLELDKPDIGRSVILPLQKIIDSPESTAHLAVLMPDQVGKELLVPRGKTFALPEDAGTQYLLIDASETTGATIRDEKTKKEITVPKLDPAEWNDVPTSATSSTAAKSP